jgi:hypothetical protein
MLVTSKVIQADCGTHTQRLCSMMDVRDLFSLEAAHATLLFVLAQ